MIGYERGCYEESGMKKNVGGSDLIMERGVSHAPKQRKRVCVVQDSLVFQKGLQLGNFF
jgi:hypothetical protein